MRDVIQSGSHFVMATYALIPVARVLWLNNPSVRGVSYNELASVALLRDFLMAPERYLRMIWDDVE